MAFWTLTVLFNIHLYIFLKANNPDELSMGENEELEIVADGDGDGWVKVKTILFRQTVEPLYHLLFNHYLVERYNHFALN